MPEKPGVPEQPSEVTYADLQETVSAFKNLSDIELAKLRRFARYRIFGLGDLARGRTGDDLLHEGFLAILEGRRRWQPSRVDFLMFFRGVLESISSHWAEMTSSHAEVLSDDGNISSINSSELDGERIAAATSPDEALSAAQVLEQIEHTFREDPVVLKIIRGAIQGKTWREMTAEFQITESEFRAADRRLRRKIEKMMRDEE